MAAYTNNELTFLAGGGELGELTRTKNWSQTPVGSPATWPQSLRSILDILLNSKFPMFLWWGSELTCFYNDAYRPSLGQNGKHPQILGMPAAEAWHEIWDTIKPLIDQVLKTGEATWNEDQLIPIYRNGKLEDVYWTFSYSAVKNEQGAIAGVLVTCTETTDKMRILHLLEERNGQLEFTIEAAELGTWDYNPLTNKFTANDRLKQWFGLPPGHEIVLNNAIDAIAPADKERVMLAIEKALDYRHGGKYDVQYTIINPQTRAETAVHAKGRAWFNEKNEAYRFNGTLENVSNQVAFTRRLEAQVQERTQELTILNESLKRNEEQLKQSSEELKLKNEHLSKTNKELEAFNYVTSHDLQEPLRKIQTFASLILEKELHRLSPSGQMQFDRMQAAAQRMQKLIKDLLAYARIDTAAMKPETVRLDAIINELKEEYREELTLKNAGIQTGPLCEVYVIPFQFRQLLHNLVNNSFKFASSERPLLITISSKKISGTEPVHAQLRPDRDYCHISVADNGIGFDQKYNEKIFGLFQRLHGKTHQDGTGIGLAIVKKIVDNHDGLITAKGEAGNGVVFDIFLPYAEMQAH